MGNPKYGEFTFDAPKARPAVKGYAYGGKVESAPTPMKSGGPTKGQAKVSKVMGEFKAGKLHSGSSKGEIVKNPKQAMAIAMAEKRNAGYKKGGKAVKEVKLVGMKMEPEAIVKKEVSLLKKAGAPAKLIKHEEREGLMPEGALSALKKGGKPKRYEAGGTATSSVPSENVFRVVDGKYIHNNEEVSKPEFEQRKKSADADMQSSRPNRERLSPRDRAKAAMREMDAAPTPMKKGGKACYAGGGSVSDTESGMQSKGSSGSGSNSDSDRALQAKEDARAAKALRDQDRGYKEHYKREEAENRADRKAVQDALMYIPRKIGQGAQSAYDAVMGKKAGGEVHSDVAMDKKVIGKAVHKHEAAMHPGKPMTKLKKGGVPTFNRTPKC